MASTLGRPRQGIVDGVQHLAAEAQGLASDVILAFPFISVASLVLEEDEAAALRQRGEIYGVRRTRKVQGSPISRDFASPMAVPGAPPWHIPLINAEKSWSRTTGRGVRVGIIDSEIDRDIADLPIVEGQTFHPETTEWWGTDDPHGTFCAAIVGCRTGNTGMVGVAPDCDLYAMRTNKGGTGSEESLIAAMAWAVEKKLHVVSLSQWDFAGADEPHEAPWEELGRAAEELTKAGCIVIGISGNSGNRPKPWVTNPGRCPAIVAVGATNADQTWWQSSSYGPDDLPEERAVELVAPGNSVLSLLPGGYAAPGSGTSFAAPQIAGACALVKQLRPDLTPSQIRSVLKTTSRDFGPLGRDSKFGVGFLDCFAAISSL
ncbi:MAG: hypothetical protein JWR51_448 [Devosia sp.]|nr:hypothetical protein [Devosia sp.]